MPEYIDCYALKNDGHLCFHDGNGNVYYEVDHAPTVDVVDVVRCKYCEYLMFSDIYGECGKSILGIVTPDDYCSRGIRRRKGW